MRTSIRLLLRGLLTWAIEAAALFLMLGVVPGLELASWSAAALAILAIGLLNALVRPAILLLAANLGVVPFMLVALPLNVVVVLAAGWLVPGFILDDSILTAFSVGAAMLWALCLLIGLAIYLLVFAFRRDPVGWLIVGDGGRVHGDWSDGAEHWPVLSGDWACQRCTYRNLVQHAACKRCDMPRGPPRS